MKYRYSSDSPAFTACNVDIQTVIRPKGYKHSHKYGRYKHGFIFTSTHSIRYDILGEEKNTITAHAGELVFIPKGTVYSCTYLENDTTIKIVQFDISDGLLPDYLSSARKINFPDTAESIRSFFSFAESSLPSHPFYYLSRLYDLLYHVDKAFFGIPKKYIRLKPALSDLSERYRENEPIAYYAALSGMSEVNFRRLFKEYTGRSPIEYRNDVRLSNARIMLGGGEFNVSEAAEACGFSNLSFFIRLYKKRYGHTPKKE